MPLLNIATKNKGESMTSKEYVLAKFSEMEDSLDLLHDETMNFTHSIDNTPLTDNELGLLSEMDVWIELMLYQIRLYKDRFISVFDDNFDSQD